MKIDKDIIKELAALGFNHKPKTKTLCEFLNKESYEGIEVTDKGVRSFALIENTREFLPALFDSTKKAIEIIEDSQDIKTPGTKTPVKKSSDDLPDFILLDEMNDERSTVERLLSLQITPEKYIVYSEGRGKDEKPSIETWYAQKCLDYAFKYKWSFRPIEVREDEPKKDKFQFTVWVEICATFDDGTVIRKRHLGTASLGSMLVGNALKSATSDGLKKAASLYGMFRNVYGAHHKGLIVR